MHSERTTRDVTGGDLRTIDQLEMGLDRDRVKGVRIPDLVQPKHNLNTYSLAVQRLRFPWGSSAESLPLAVGSVWTQARVGRTSRRFASSYSSVAVALVLFQFLTMGDEIPPHPPGLGGNAPGEGVALQYSGVSWQSSQPNG